MISFKSFRFIGLFVIVFGYSCSNSKMTNHALEDGIYLVKEFVSDTMNIRKLTSNEQLINYNPKFTNDSSNDYSKLIVSTDQFVALRLKRSPETQTEPDNRKILLLDFHDDQAKKLYEFTANHIMQKVAIVIGTEGVSVHKIRTAITGGKLQITRCTDNGCERLYYELEHDVK